MAWRWTARLVATALLSVAAPAAAATALLPGQSKETPPAPAATAAPSIDAESEAGADARIARRIEGIFGVLPALSRVTVSVREGVVTLGGTVPTPADVQRAEQIASRIDGVVTVENAIERVVSVQESFGLLGDISDRVGALVRMLPLVGVAIAVAAGIALIGYALASLSLLWRRLAPNQFLAGLIASAVRFVFVVGGIVVALDMIGAGALLGAVLGGAGIIGIALGFAMRDTTENYVASILLSVRQPFRANDWVVIDSYEGRVVRLTSRATILMTLDGNHLRIPNSNVFKAVILNFTRNPQRRFEFDLGIDADDDATAARHLGIEVLSQLDFVLSEPAPAARVEQVGDSNIVVRYLAWIDQEKTDWYKARSRAIPAVKDALEAAGFAIPEPIYRLRFDQNVPAILGKFDGEAESLPAAPPPAAEKRGTVRSAAATAERVSPDDEIVDMVERERTQSPEAASDLLDSGRPVE